MRKFACDFETTTRLDDCRVWAYAICEIGNAENFIYGNDLDAFMKWCANPKENYLCLFHNLKFDGEFIMAGGMTAVPDLTDAVLSEKDAGMSVLADVPFTFTFGDITFTEKSVTALYNIFTQFAFRLPS